MKYHQWNRATLRRSAVVGIMSAILVLSGCKDNLTDVEYVERAREHQDQGNLQSSVIELKNALQRNPENPEARWLLGRIYVEMDDGAAAEKELRRAVELGIAREAVMVPLAKALLLQGQGKTLLEEIPVAGGLSPETRAELHALRGRAYLGEGKLDEAAAEFQPALDTHESSPAARLGQAHLAMARQQWDEAREWIDRTLEVLPTWAEAWSLRGDLESFVGEASKAEEAYSRAIDHRWNNAQDLLKRAVVRIGLEDYEGAQGDIRTLRRVMPRHPGVQYLQGLVHFQQRQFEAAQTAFQEALRSDPNYLPAVFYMGVTHYLHDHLQQAAQYLNQYLNAFPHSDQAAVLLAVVRMRGGDLASAESLLQPVLGRNPEDPLVLNLIGNLYLAQGRAEGIEHLQKAITLQPDVAETHMRLGLGLMMQGERTQGIQALETAIEIDPQLQQAEVTLIASYLQAGEFEQAIVAAERLQAKQPDSPLSLNLKGLAYLAKGDRAKALEIFTLAWKLAPGDPSSARNLARLALEDGQIDQALSIYRDVLKHHPGHLRTLLQLSSLELNRGQVQEARAWLEQAMQAHPQALEPRVHLASYHLLTGQPAQALTTLQPIREIYPNHPALLAVLGEAQLSSQQPANAVNTFQRLAQVQPQSAQARYLLAKAYGALNNEPRSRKALNEALELDPDHVLAKIARIRLLTQENKLEEANALLQELKQAHPQNPEIMAQEGSLALRQGRPQEAVEAFANAVRFIPSSRLIMNLAQAQWQVGDREASIATLESWLGQFPNDVAARFYLASLYLALDRQALARSSFAQIVEQVPDNALALNNLAWLLRKDDPGRALKYAERALELAPDAPPIMDTLGILLLDRGQTQRALRLLRDASEMAPGDVNIRYHLVLALVGSGDEDQARKMLQELLAEQRSFPDRLEAESLLQSLGG